jgi:hypothetical protein
LPAKNALSKLSVQGAVHVLLVFAFGDQDVHPVVLPQPSDEVAADHRVPTAEQPDGRESSLLNLASGRIDDVKERQIHSALDPISSGVHSVAGKEEEIRTGRLEFVALFGQQITDQIPPAFALIAFDLFEIGLRQHQAGAVQAAITQPLGDQFVDDPVIDDRTRPSDAPTIPMVCMSVLQNGRTIAGIFTQLRPTIDLSEIGSAELDCGGVVRHGRHLVYRGRRLNQTPG